MQKSNLGSEKLVVFDAANEQFFDRADRFAKEFGLKAIIRGSGREYRRLEEIKASVRSWIGHVSHADSWRLRAAVLGGRKRERHSA